MSPITVTRVCKRSKDHIHLTPYQNIQTPVSIIVSNINRPGVLTVTALTLFLYHVLVPISSRASIEGTDVIFAMATSHHIHVTVIVNVAKIKSAVRVMVNHFSSKRG
uniref:Uncharacterized protein n=2 Tax=environmental samples TaxID=68359 RepID=A0A075GRU8_9EURY|nr:hypothetical protein [uncultured marine group II/III euryarchaeote KM3_177_C07]AIF06374.1 hypothetical protein [uncultured marine group II/III euryarchaeote KM3_191_F05]